MQKVSFFFLLILLIMPLSLHAQDDCDINLEDEMLALKDAQSQADSGDTISAATTLQALSETLSAIAENCLGGDGMIEEVIDELAIEEFIAEDGSIAFQYPQDWIVQSAFEGSYVMATSEEVAEAIDSDLPPSLNPSEFGIIIQSTPLLEDTFDEIVSEIENDIEDDEEFEIVESIQSLTVNGRDAVQIVLDFGENVRLLIVLIDYSDAQIPTAILVAGVGNVDEFQMTQNYVTAVAESLQFPPSQ